MYKKLRTIQGILTVVLVFSAILNLVNCAANKDFSTWEPIPDDKQHVPEAPEEVEINILKDAFNKQIIDQFDQLLDLPRAFRKVSGNPKEALDVDPFGEVYNSSWYTNRNTKSKLTVDEIAKGPNTGVGPDQSGSWVITRAKAQGVTPGFSIKDKNGDNFVIKFEPTGFRELSSGAEVVSTKLFYAAGYNVPENYITYFDPSILVLEDNVKFTDEKGQKRFMNQNDLEEIVNRLELLPDGKVRAVASKYIQGRGLGPFKYYKTRADDPNDFIPHQYRRELRGMRVFAAWLGHYDTKANNSYDAYVTDDSGKSYVKHYMMDFGSTLGSQSSAPKQDFIGFENQFDTKALFLNILTLGLYVRPYERLDYDYYPSIGRFTSQHFHPQKYKFIFPNPSFEKMTDIDGYWGARLVMSFTDEQIKAVVESAQYTDNEAKNYLINTLIERRDIVGRYWFEKMNPLDYFEIITRPAGSELQFKDIALESGLENPVNTSYKYEIFVDDGEFNITGEIKQGERLQIPSINLQDKDQYIVIRIKTNRSELDKSLNPVSIYLSKGSENNYKIAGIQR